LTPIGGSGVSGNITFEKVNNTHVAISVNATGLQAGSTHGIHIHQVRFFFSITFTKHTFFASTEIFLIPLQDLLLDLT
jgi:hypothetical protein